LVFYPEPLYTVTQKKRCDKFIYSKTGAKAPLIRLEDCWRCKTLYYVTLYLAKIHTHADARTHTDVVSRRLVLPLGIKKFSSKQDIKS